MHSSAPSPRHPIGIHRRELLQVGYSGLMGMGLAGLMPGVGRAKTADRPARAKSLILIFLTGAPSHHDTFDMKPEAPAEVRGELKPIASRVPGLQVCELLPQMAARAEHYAIVRTLAHGDNNHLMSTHMLLTGHVQPGAFFDKIASRDDWPCYSAALDYLHPRRDPIPTGVNLPNDLVQRPLTWPGQHAGLLGATHDPWQIKADPNEAGFRVDALQLAPGIDVERFHQRRELLAHVSASQSWLAQAAENHVLSNQQHKAFELLTSSGLAKAFDLEREPQEARERYGRSTIGQSLLLARRLSQAGVPVVQVNAGRAQTWDHHSNIFPTLRKLLPPLDQGVAALLDDLHGSGALDETLVVLLGEFGRTPKINTPAGAKVPGRDHWGNCFFGLFAGGGVQGGQVIGKSDRDGAFPATNPYSPGDVGATIYRALGLDPASEIRDRLDRPLRLNLGTPIAPLFTGEA